MTLKKASDHPSWCPPGRWVYLAAAAGYTHLPGGHQEGWSDAFFNVIRDIYRFIAEGHPPSHPRPPAFATFEDGYHSACVVEAILHSHRHGAAWTKVPALIGASR